MRRVDFKFRTEEYYNEPHCYRRRFTGAVHPPATADIPISHPTATATATAVVGEHTVADRAGVVGAMRAGPRPGPPSRQCKGDVRTAALMLAATLLAAVLIPQRSGNLAGPDAARQSTLTLPKPAAGLPLISGRLPVQSSNGRSEAGARRANQALPVADKKARAKPTRPV
jgi:hypothetical protein